MTRVSFVGVWSAQVWTFSKQNIGIVPIQEMGS